MHASLDRLVPGRSPAFLRTAPQEIVGGSSLRPHEQSISQEVESEFFGCAIRNIGSIGFSSLVLVVIGEHYTRSDS
jgi:hypothetical protein